MTMGQTAAATATFTRRSAHARCTKKSKARPHLFSKTSCLFARPKKSKPAPSLYAHFFSFLALPCFFLFYFFLLIVPFGGRLLFVRCLARRTRPARACALCASVAGATGRHSTLFRKKRKRQKRKKEIAAIQKKDKATSRAQECDRGDRSAFSLCALLAVAHARAAAAPTFDQKKRKGMTPAGRIGQFLSILFIR